MAEEKQFPGLDSWMPWNATAKTAEWYLLISTARFARAAIGPIGVVPDAATAGSVSSATGREEKVNSERFSPPSSTRPQ